MQNQLQIFNNEEFGKIRVSGTPDYPLFCLADLCKMLEIGNPSDVKNRLGDGVVSIEVIFDALGRKQNAAFVNEDGLYDVILDSRKPEARRIRKWITSEVMPSIRKRGVYATEDFIQKTIANPKWAIDVLTAYQEEKDKNKALLEENTELLQQVEDLKPKASYYDSFIASNDLVLASTIAFNYDIGVKTFNKLLHNLGIQYRDDKGVWHLYAKYLGNGWAKIVTTQSKKNGKYYDHMKWTRKGQIELYYLLKEHVYLPKCEQE